MARQTVPPRILSPIVAPRQRFDAAPFARRALLALNGFLGITATAGGLGLLVGWIMPGEELLDGSPFSSYVIPGLVLLLVVGGSALAAAWAVLCRQPMAAPLSALAGLMIMAYETVEFTVIGFHWLQLAYFAVGIAIVALAARLWALRSRSKRAG
jgi:hypothetical protein